MMLRTLLQTFLRSDQGAVTVDWTVLTGSMVGLGVAGISTISVGLSDLTSDIDRSLRLMGVTEFARTLISTDTFDGGSLGKWSSNIASYDDPVLKNMMGPFRDESGDATLFRSLEFIEGTEYAVMEFDLTTIGKWEASDDMRLYVDGQMIDTTSLMTGNLHTTFDDGNDETQIAYSVVETRKSDSDVVTERMELAKEYDPVGYNANPRKVETNVRKETDYTVQVVVKNPGKNMNFGIGRGRGNTSPQPGEAWAIDNFAVSSSIDEDDVTIDANS